MAVSNGVRVKSKVFTVIFVSHVQPSLFPFLLPSLVKDFGWYIGAKQLTKTERVQRINEEFKARQYGYIDKELFLNTCFFNGHIQATCVHFLRSKRKTFHLSFSCTIKLSTSKYMKDHIFVLQRKI